MYPQQIIDIAERLSDEVSYRRLADHGYGSVPIFDPTRFTPEILGFTYTQASFGTTRAVFLGENVVFKMIKNGNNTYHNTIEWELYSMLPDWARIFFCRPLYISQNHRVIVMERIESFSNTLSYSDVTRLRKHFESKISNGDEVYRLFSDDGTSNFGRKNGQIQFLDYANSFNVALIQSFNDLNSVRLALRDSFPVFLTSDI